MDDKSKARISEKGENSNKNCVSGTNVSKAKELLSYVMEEKSEKEVKNNGFRFSYEDPNLSDKFKKLFGKNGVMDLLADAWMTKNLTSNKVYSFADMRNELKVYYKNLKLQAFNNAYNSTEFCTQKIKDLNQDLEAVLTEYKLEMIINLEKLKKISNKSKKINQISNLIKAISATLTIIGAFTVQPTILMVSRIIASVNSLIECSNKIYVQIRNSSIKKTMKKYQRDFNCIYKQIKSEYMKSIVKAKDLANKTLKIEKYNKKILEEFSGKCRNISEKYYVKKNNFKIWSKNLTKLKEIFKGGIHCLMEK